ncbi:MAG: phosphate ABC transporter, permease protein PstA, partial [Endomicrobiales bacterium]
MNPKRYQKLAFCILLAATLCVIVPVLVILCIIVKQGYSAITWEFLTAMPRDGMRAGGIFPAIVGTLSIVITAISITLPVGVGAAIYLNEYAQDNALTRIIKLSIVNLAGVPSVVYGLFGLGLFVIF